MSLVQALTVLLVSLGASPPVNGPTTGLVGKSCRQNPGDYPRDWQRRRPDGQTEGYDVRQDCDPDRFEQDCSPEVPSCDLAKAACEKRERVACNTCQVACLDTCERCRAAGAKTGARSSCLGDVAACRTACVAQRQPQLCTDPKAVCVEKLRPSCDCVALDRCARACPSRSRDAACLAKCGSDDCFGVCE